MEPHRVELNRTFWPTTVSGRVLWYLAAGFALLAIAAIFWVPQLNSDFATLLLGWDNFCRDGHFNTLISPDPTNIALDTHTFITWWSPGPAVLVGAVEATHVPLNLVLASWLCGATVLQLAGWREVYRRLE